MEYNNVEKLFENKFNYDKKHKLNTSPKELPLKIIENINKGITLEQLNEILAKGYDIYKYSTQITIHGICNELTDNNVCRYKSLILNKNKSLGVKWIALDAEKKSDICKKLSYFEWHTTHTSQKFYPSLIERFSNLQDAQKRCNEYKIIADRIDNDLFFGSYNIYIGEAFGMYFAIFDLFINGIKQENVTPLLEKILDMDNETITNKINSIEAERKRKSDEFHELYLKEQKEQKENREQIVADTINQLVSDGYKKTFSNELKVGTRFKAIEERYYEVYLVEYEVTSRTCLCLSKMDILKNKDSYETDNAKIYKDKPFEVWVK